MLIIKDNFTLHHQTSVNLLFNQTQSSLQLQMWLQYYRKFMAWNIKVFFMLCCALGLKVHAFGQTTDSANYKKSVDYIAATFNKAAGLQSSIYYGVSHDEYNPTIKGSAYFGSGEWQKGSVIYKGIKLENVTMRLDVVTDELLIQYPDQISAVILDKNYVKQFALAGHNFHKITADSTQDVTVSGYYEKLNDGLAVAYAKRKKIIQENISREISKEFTDRNSYFIEKGSKWYKVPNENAVLKILNDKKDPMKQYVQNSNINFRENPERAIVAMVVYYNQL